MSTQPWRQLPPPPADGPVRPRWQWEISRPAELTAARCSLRAALAGGVLPAGAAPDDLDRLLLAFEELASNGLRHTRQPVTVTVASTAGGWLIDVGDARPDRPPTPAVDRDPALGGMGLHLIARLSARCGWAVVGSRKHVWACLTPAVP
jgi:anti-sigma regulatory factor (Ser/Thr protein kinase)